MNELKKADEIVRALRDYASDCDSDSEYCFQCTFACVCDKFDNNAPKIIADLIESLTSQLAESQRREQAAVKDLERLMKGLGGQCCALCEKKDSDCGFSTMFPCSSCNPKWHNPPQDEKGEAE